ncbi:hypothetical protein AOXY_G37585 [Acipenser oxyrinchus oxyrinchus]|uniref:Uncharacterized protein n=1 Tax=Acipenser oxyrinchus oxyrinchus TaxID=40147 RepID=A0AAD8CDS7_ACIOX|nr:hypothetical protein AOXY_G37585 [Acipenser oxyrinchus oxyrinchus]
MKMKGYLSSSQRTSTTRHLPARAPRDSLGSPPDRRPWDGAAQPPVSRGSPDIDELERSLRELNMQVRSLASSLDLGLRTEGAGGSDMTTSTLDRAPSRERASMDWFLNPEHLVDSLRGQGQTGLCPQQAGWAVSSPADSTPACPGAPHWTCPSLWAPPMLSGYAPCCPDPRSGRRPGPGAPPAAAGDPEIPRLAVTPAQEEAVCTRSHSPQPPRGPLTGDRQPWSPYSLAPLPCTLHGLGEEGEHTALCVHTALITVYTHCTDHFSLPARLSRTSLHSPGLFSSPLAGWTRTCQLSGEWGRVGRSAQSRMLTSHLINEYRSTLQWKIKHLLDKVIY